MKLTSGQKNILTIAAVGTVALFFVGSAFRRAYESASTNLNPASTDNLVYRGVNAVGDILDDGADDESFSLGVWLYEITHPNENFDFYKPPASEVKR